MRWRSGLMGFSLIGGSCLEVGVLDPSILKTERPPVTCARSNGYCGRCNAPDRPARALPRERVRSLANNRHPHPEMKASPAEAKQGGLVAFLMDANRPQKAPYATRGDQDRCPCPEI